MYMGYVTTLLQLCVKEAGTCVEPWETTLQSKYNKDLTLFWAGRSTSRKLLMKICSQKICFDSSQQLQLIASQFAQYLEI